MKNFWQNLPKPIISLAPMDGYTDSSFRQICKLINPKIILFTEFIASDGIVFNKNRLNTKYAFTPSELPLIVQIFGKKIDSFVTATKFFTDRGFSGIDLNMGCPAKKVVKSEHGIALRKKPDLAYKLIEAVANSTHLPISVKTRLGWENADDLIEFALGCQNAGANLITIHGRTFKAPYKVPANFEPIYELKNHLKIPVLGNGGIINLEDGLAKLKNLDGFMIGQSAIKNPWVFAEKNQRPTSLQEKIPLIKKHAEFLLTLKGEEKGAREMRKFLLNYVRDFPFAKQMRKQICEVSNLEEIFKVLDFTKNTL